MASSQQTPQLPGRSAPNRSWSFQLTPSSSEGENNHNGNSNNDEHLTEAERNLKHSAQIPFYKFVLTGGPCGGKNDFEKPRYYYFGKRLKVILSILNHKIFA